MLKHDTRLFLEIKPHSESWNIAACVLYQKAWNVRQNCTACANHSSQNEVYITLHIKFSVVKCIGHQIQALSFTVLHIFTINLGKNIEQVLGSDFIKRYFITVCIFSLSLHPFPCNLPQS